MAQRPASAPSSDTPAKRRGVAHAFVCKLPMVVTPDQHKILNQRLEALRQIYNGVLDKMLGRLVHLRTSPAWRQARTMSKGKARRTAFKAACVRGRLTQLAAEQYARKLRDGCWFGEVVGSHDTQTTAARAFQAVMMYMFGKRGKPRFKSKGRMRSIAGKMRAVLLREEMESPRRWAGFIGPMPARPAVRYRGLVMPCLVDPKDAYTAAALAARTVYVRIVRSTRKGKEEWEAQFVQEGHPPQRRAVGTGKATLDIGPSTIAIVAWEEGKVVGAALERFCPLVKKPGAARRRTQRRMDRSLRATNPHAFHPDGRFKRGARITTRSRHFLRLRAQLREEERCLAAERRRAHGELSNRILAIGAEVWTEKLSYKAFQRRFGASVARAAPGAFVTTLSRKAASAGGGVVLIPTWSTKLSQACHKTETYTKKPLSVRVHRFPDGSFVDRDLYAAFLAGCVRWDREGKAWLSLHQAQAAWSSAGPRLEEARRQHRQGVIARTIGAGTGVGGACPVPPPRQNAWSPMV